MGGQALLPKGQRSPCGMNVGSAGKRGDRRACLIFEIVIGVDSDMSGKFTG